MMGSPWRAGWMRLASSRHRGIPERAAPTVDLYITQKTIVFLCTTGPDDPRAESTLDNID